MASFSKSIPEIYGYANLWPLYISTGGGERLATQSEYDSYTVKFKNLCQAYIDKASSIFGSNSQLSLDRGYSINYDNVPKPSLLVETLEEKKGTPIPDFKKRSLRGEILMSNYDRFHVKITREAALKMTTGSRTSGTISFSNMGLGYDLGRAGLSVFPGTRCSALNAGSVAFGHWRQNGQGDWVFPPSISPESFLSNVLATKPPSTHLVTEVLSSANQRALDILTAMAEMPETIKSVLSGFRSIAKMVKDVKKGEIHLSKSFEKRKEYLTKKFRSDMDRINHSLKGAHKYKRILLERQRKRITNSHSKAMKGAADEFASAVASLWLNFRYNIMPNVYLVEDIEKVWNQWGREWTSTRQGERSQSSFSFYGHELNFEWLQRCLIKRTFDLNKMGKNSSLLSANLAVTAWELIPLSFVVDWFINIGDLLSSVTTPQSWTQEGCSLSYLTEINQTIDFSNSPGFNGVITFEAKIYNRLSINPLDYVGLVWQPDLSPVRQLDALALLWRPVRLLLSNIKKEI